MKKQLRIWVISFQRPVGSLDIQAGSLWHKRAGAGNSSKLSSTPSVEPCYQVTVSLNAHDNTEHTSSFINLFKNGEMTEESYIYSATGGDGDNWSYEMAARTMFFRLVQGDQVYLYCENCFDIQFINICFKLDTKDV